MGFIVPLFQMKELRLRKGIYLFYHHIDTKWPEGLNPKLRGSEVHTADHTLPHVDSIH